MEMTELEAQHVEASDRDDKRFKCKVCNKDMSKRFAFSHFSNRVKHLALAGRICAEDDIRKWHVCIDGQRLGNQRKNAAGDPEMLLLSKKSHERQPLQALTNKIDALTRGLAASQQSSIPQPSDIIIKDVIRNWTKGDAKHFVFPLKDHGPHPIAGTAYDSYVRSLSVRDLGDMTVAKHERGLLYFFSMIEWVMPPDVGNEGGDFAQKCGIIMKLQECEMIQQLSTLPIMKAEAGWVDTISRAMVGFTNHLINHANNTSWGGDVRRMTATLATWKNLADKVKRTKLRSQPRKEDVMKERLEALPCLSDLKAAVKVAMLDCFVIFAIMSGRYVPDACWDIANNVDLKWACTIATACVVLLNAPAGRHGDFIHLQVGTVRKALANVVDGFRYVACVEHKNAAYRVHGKYIPPGTAVVLDMLCKHGDRADEDALFFKHARGQHNALVLPWSLMRAVNGKYLNRGRNGKLPGVIASLLRKEHTVLAKEKSTEGAEWLAQQFNDHSAKTQQLYYNIKKAETCARAAYIYAENFRGGCEPFIDTSAITQSEYDAVMARLVDYSRTGRKTPQRGTLLTATPSIGIVMPSEIAPCDAARAATQITDNRCDVFSRMVEQIADGESSTELDTELAVSDDPAIAPASRPIGDESIVCVDDDAVTANTQMGKEAAVRQDPARRRRYKYDAVTRKFYGGPGPFTFSKIATSKTMQKKLPKTHSVKKRVKRRPRKYVRHMKQTLLTGISERAGRQTGVDR